LDDEERLKFAQSRHEYIIEQIQYLSPIYVNKDDMLTGKKIIDLNFKNCVKDIFWYCKTETNILQKDYLNFTSNVSSYNQILATCDNINLYTEYFPNMVSIFKTNILAKKCAMGIKYDMNYSLTTDNLIYDTISLSLSYFILYGKSLDVIKSSKTKINKSGFFQF
jgi:hypothetical protein